MQKIAYAGWKHCLKLSNGKVELVITTDVGPRVIRFGFVGGQNLFKEYPDQLGRTGGRAWRIYGGHRLWHAPEAKPRTYAPDNAPVRFTGQGNRVQLVQAVEKETGIQKEMELALDAGRNHVTVRHRLVNRNPWDVEFAVWSLSVMAPGGRALYPHEPFKAHTDYLLPARPMVLWHYTDMRDPRWTWGTRYFQLRQDPRAAMPQKIGFLNRQGWAAYALRDEVFLKRFAPVPGAVYPDWGCNTETFTNADMLEVETLSPLQRVPAGGAIEHTEHWYLFKAEPGAGEASVDRVLRPLLRQTRLVR